MVKHTQQSCVMRVMQVSLALLALLLTLCPLLTYAADLALLSPSLGKYTASTQQGDGQANMTLSIDYSVNVPIKALFLQVDNSIQEVRQKNFITLHDNPQFNQEGMLYISPIKNWLRYNFSLYLSEQKPITLTLMDSAQKQPLVGLMYLDGPTYEGWFCYEGKGIRQLNIPSTLYYDMTIELKHNGRYYYEYDVYDAGEKVSTCTLPNTTLDKIDLISITNENKERIITQSTLAAGSYSAQLPPGYHKVILFAYKSDGSLYNVSKELFIVIDGCGDLQCDVNDCAYDCAYENQVQKGVSMPDWLGQDDFILTIDSTDRLVHENGRVYLLFDLAKNQYDATFTLLSLGGEQFYTRDYYFKSALNNLTDLFTFTVDQTVLGRDLISLDPGSQHTVHVRADNLAEFSIGDNYGVLDFGAKTAVYYKLTMPRNIYSQLHLPPETGVPTFTDRFLGALKEHYKLILLFAAILIIILIIAWHEKKKIRATTQRIREKYGVDLEL